MPLVLSCTAALDAYQESTMLSLSHVTVAVPPVVSIVPCASTVGSAVRTHQPLAGAFEYTNMKRGTNESRSWQGFCEPLVPVPV